MKSNQRRDPLRKLFALEEEEATISHKPAADHQLSLQSRKQRQSAAAPVTATTTTTYESPVRAISERDTPAPAADYISSMAAVVLRRRRRRQSISSADNHFVVYNTTTRMQINNSKQTTASTSLPHRQRQRLAGRRVASATSSSNYVHCKLSAPTLSSLALAFGLAALASCMFASQQTQAFSSSSSAASLANDAASVAAASAPSSSSSVVTSGSQAGSSQQKQSGPNARLDNWAPEATGSSSSSQASIVASLSSAVASAAAAAAVAAAQNGLTSSDARSLLSSAAAAASSANGGGSLSGSSSGAGHHRSPTLRLALKLADTIPEVPYNILHNMKKLDHAAPFYNVPNKLTGSGSTGKESASSHVSSLLASALSADQLGSLFRSPIWKRLADGYGEFTSEFRSLFRAPPTTMKGPTSSAATKLLRDISVPAMLMLLASTALPTDWRPVRTRRKSLAPAAVADQMAAAAAAAPMSVLDPMSAVGASEALPNSPFSFAPQQQQQQLYRPISAYNLQQALAREGLSHPLMQSAYPSSSSSFGQQPAPGDFNLQAAGGAAAAAAATSSMENAIGGANNWISSSQQAQLTSDSQPQSHLEAAAQLQQQQQQQLKQQQQQSIRRIGDSLGGDSRHQRDIKPVKSDRLHAAGGQEQQQPTAAGGLFSSLTSTAIGQSRLMGKLMNANGIIGDKQQQQQLGRRAAEAAAVDGGQLNDKQRYSLVDLEDSSLSGDVPANEQQQQQQRISSKPFLLSAMTQAFGSMFNAPPESGSSYAGAAAGSDLSSSTTSGRHNMLTTTTTAGDRTINQRDASLLAPMLSRRQQQVVQVGEQRELSQLIPQSWREVVKRTVNNVQQQATTQWKSIEGQLANWVQDRLKTFPTVIAPSGGATSTGSTAATAPLATSIGAGGQATAPAVANIIASVSSTAMNILGLGNKSVQAASPASSSAAAGDLATAATTGDSQKVQKTDAARPAPSGPKGALAGVANMIVNTLTGTSRQQTPASTTSAAAGSGQKAAAEELATSVASHQYPTANGAASSGPVGSQQQQPAAAA